MSYAAYPYVARGPNGRWRYLSGLAGLGATPTMTTVQIVLTGNGDDGTRIVQTQLQRLNFLAPGTGPTGVDGKWGDRTALAMSNAARYVGYTDGPPYTVSGTTVSIPTALLGLLQAATPAQQGTPGAISSSSSTSSTSTTTVVTPSTATTTTIGPTVDQASAAASGSAAGPLIALGAGVLLVAGLVFWGSWKTNKHEPKSTRYESHRSTHLFARRVKRNARGIKNDRERELWVMNDEGLYDWWKSSRMSKAAFIKAHRAELDEIIDKVVNAPPREKTWRDYY